MSQNGLIDGNAPPFILLVFILGSMYSSWNVLKEIEQLPGGINFKRKSRAITVTSLSLYFLLGILVLIRIGVNGFIANRDFKILDCFILSGIFVSYVAIIINALVVSAIKRKYVLENPPHPQPIPPLSEPVE